MSTEEQVREFGRVWAAAEERGDTETLAGLAAEGFRLVGPLGFVLLLVAFVCALAFYFWRG